MAVVVQYIRDYAPWVYGACALVALWYLRVAIRARRERRFAVFSLEREAALNRTYGAWTMAFVLASVMGITYFMSTIVSDAVEPLVDKGRFQTPTPMIVVEANPSPTLPLPEPTTPTPTPTPGKPTPTTTRPTQTPEPTEEPATPVPAVQPPRCPDARSIISAPGINGNVSGMVAVQGTAVHENFQYYKLEFGAGTNPAVWSYFAGGEQPVQGGHLGAFNSGAVPPGTYSIRLVVVDTTGNYPPPCQTVVVVN